MKYIVQSFYVTTQLNKALLTISSNSALLVELLHRNFELLVILALLVVTLALLVILATSCTQLLVILY